MLTKAERREIQFDRLDHVLENCQHYLNGVRNRHKPSREALMSALRDILVSVTVLE